MPDFENAAQGFPLLTGGAMFVYLFIFLFRRGDAQQLENMRQLTKQRDGWQERAERAEAEKEELDEAFDRFRADQQQLRHELKSRIQGERMEKELWRRRAVQAGWTEPDG